MKRRKFINDTSVFVFGLGVFGNIAKAENSYVGDSPTTTDILGPFYRPGAPYRNNLNPKGFTGEILHLKGTVYREDGVTPVSAGLIELWQCKPDGIYDNTTDEYRYRAAQKIPKSGSYHFITTQPVAYPVEEGSTVYRPAHIHLRVSALGSQDLITQVYFTGDPYLDSDPSTKSELSLMRILSKRKIRDNEIEIRFNIVLKKESLANDELFHKVSGIYKMSNNSMMEFYRDGDLLFYKTNNQIWGALSYAGNNSFVGGVNDTHAKFEFLEDKVKVQFSFIRRRKTEIEGTKYVQYPS